MLLLIATHVDVREACLVAVMLLLRQRTAVGNCSVLSVVRVMSWLGEWRCRRRGVVDVVRSGEVVLMLGDCGYTLLRCTNARCGTGEFSVHRRRVGTRYMLLYVLALIVVRSGPARVQSFVYLGGRLGIVRRCVERILCTSSTLLNGNVVLADLSAGAVTVRWNLSGLLVLLRRACVLLRVPPPMPLCRRESLVGHLTSVVVLVCALGRQLGLLVLTVRCFW